MSARTAIATSSARDWNTCSSCNAPILALQRSAAVSACRSLNGRNGSTSPVMRLARLLREWKTGSNAADRERRVIAHQELDICFDHARLSAKWRAQAVQQIA